MTDHSNVSEVRSGALDRGVPTYNQTRPVEYHTIGSQAGGGGGANYAYPGTGAKYDIKGLRLMLSFSASAVGLAAAAAVITVTFYELKDGVYYLLDTVTTTNPAVAAGSVGKAKVDYTVKGATHFAIAGTIAVAAGSTVYFGYDLYSDQYVSIDVGDIEIGAVEIKNGSSDTRATVQAANAGSTAATTVLITQNIDANGKVISGGGGIPASSHASPIDGAVAYTSNVTVTCSGFPFVVDDANCVISYLLYKPTGGTWQNMLVNGQSGVSMVASANVITVAGAGTPFAAGDSYRVGIRYQDKAYIAATNHNRSAEISPLDTRDVLVSAIAANITLNNSALYYPAAAATPTSCWNAFTNNANGGGSNKLSWNGSSIPPNTKTAILTMYASNDPNATVASKRWTQVAFKDDVSGNTVTSLTMTGNAGGTAQPFAISTVDNFGYNFVVLLLTTNDNVTAIYIDGANRRV